VLLNPNESNGKKALSIGLGVFMGIVPIWGFQMLVALLLASLMRLNKALVLIAANISIPPMIPLIIFGSFMMGRVWMGTDATFLVFSKDITQEAVQRNVLQYLYGSVTLAVIAGLTMLLVSYVFLTIFRKKKA